MITGLKEISSWTKGRLIAKELLKKHTTFRIGGPADIWIEPLDIYDLQNCVLLAKENNIPLFILGGGSNLLVKDEGIRGVVVSMKSHSMKKIFHGDTKIVVTSSVGLAEFLRFCANNELSGLEFLSGVPGSIGGSIMTNAGARHYENKNEWKSIGDYVVSIKAMDYDGNIHVLKKKDICFAYRKSGLSDYIILEVKFMLTRQDKKSILGECNKYLSKKKTTQDLSYPSAGCVFKNPTDLKKSAGELIDSLGLKGKKIGEAMVSKKHANFIVNTGQARASDVLSLIELIKKEVMNKYGVKLELEIEVV